jgi:hypothetical protein
LWTSYENISERLLNDFNEIIYQYTEL